MTLESAPFHAEVADAPEGTQAYWIRSADGLRLRAAWFPTAQARGTVLLFPGRTEYVEKYGRLATDLTGAGYHVVAIDWRGQGLSDRLLRDNHIGHVAKFEDYQSDITALINLTQMLDLPGPRVLLAHSMGGCIGLRAVMDGLDVAACAFSGPMWGIKIPLWLRPIAWGLSYLSGKIGLGHLYAPGTNAEAYPMDVPFEDNLLTTDPQMFSYMHDQVRAVPELRIGGPSMNWLFEALREMRILAARPAPALPCFTFCGDNERIVDVPRIHARMEHWRNGRLEMIKGGEHEILMETPAIRAEVTRQLCAFFDSATHA